MHGFANLVANVNSFANGTDDISFPELLNRIAAIDGKFRLRFMTSHPKDFSEELAKAIAASDKICKAVHLPVQSGSASLIMSSERLLRSRPRTYGTIQ